ncbi:MAG: metal-dependent transcriptional regulator [Spirochaetales bacterium]
MTTDPYELSLRFPAAGNYLIQMFLFDREQTPVVPSDIARRLEVSPAAVTQSLKRLEVQGFLKRHPARGFSLTEAGRSIAKRIIARHYLVERLLVDKLGVAWDVADEEADHLQQGLTPRMEQILTAQLGNPQTCPHGNPFPESPAESEILAAPPITTVAPGSTVEIVRVTEWGEMVPGLLAFCSRHGVGIGSRFVVLSAADSSPTDVVRLCPQPSASTPSSKSTSIDHELAIPLEFARFICIKYITT